MREANCAVGLLGHGADLGHAQVNNHNRCSTVKGRLWLAGDRYARRHDPDFCEQGLGHAVRQGRSRSTESERQLAMLDPKTMKYTFVDTCFGTHHLQFGFDNDNTLWTQRRRPVVGWLDTKKFDETGDAQKAQGWAPFVLDTTGTGKRRRVITSPASRWIRTRTR